MTEKEAFNAWWEENHETVSHPENSKVNRKFTAYKAWEAGVNFAISVMNGSETVDDSALKMPEEFRKAWLAAVDEKRKEDEIRSLGNFIPKKRKDAQG